jgi:4-oxalocrotonate tautomerase
MPHLVVKMYAGRTDAEKAALTEKLTQAVEAALGYGPESISVGIEDVKPADWMDKVYQPDIVARQESLTKRPGYGPLA